MTFPVTRKFQALLLLLLIGTSAVTGQTETNEVASDGAQILERGRFFYAQGVVFEAIKEYERYVEIVPDDIDALLFLSQLHVDVGYDDRAAIVLARILQLEPDNERANALFVRIRNTLAQRVDPDSFESLLQYARICARPGSYQRAATYYRRALAIENATSIHLELARMLSWASSFEEAGYHYNIVLARNPGALDVMREAGRIFNASGDFPRAIEVLESYLARRPDDISALLELTQALVWSGRGDEGGQRLKELIEREPGRIDVMLVQGSLAELEDRILDAYQVYRDVLQRDPDNQDAAARIQALERDHRMDIARLRDRIASSEDDMDAYLALATLFAEQQRYSDAISLLEKANRQAPEHKEIFTTLRRLRSNDLQRVQHRLMIFRERLAVRQEQEVNKMRSWLAENPSDARTRMRLARILFDAGQYVAAEAELRLVQQEAPLDPLALEMMNLIMTRKAQQRAEGGDGRLLQ